jgi:uncharacterized protein YjdB
VKVSELEIFHYETTEVPAAGITLNPSSLMGHTESGSTNIEAAVSPNNASCKMVAWVSTHPEVATVSDIGIVDFTGKGTAKIIATTFDGGYSDTCNVVVYQNVASVSLYPEIPTVALDSTLQLSAIVSPSNTSVKSMLFSSENEAIATVDETTGLLMAHAIGQTSVKVEVTDSLNNVVEDVCVVTVEKTSAVTETQEASFCIYPNPVSSQLQIKSMQMTEGNNYELRGGEVLKIFNIMGQTVETYPQAVSHDGVITLDVSILPSGIYVLKIGNYRGNFVKE